MSNNPDGLLTIRELAEAAGLTTATIRAWEQRYGFPEPHRLPSGHRRYAADVVAVVREVVRRRDAGMRLDVAIAEAVAQRRQDAAPGSVFAELRRAHPSLAAYRLRKSTLLGLSWAIEDEFCAKAAAPVLVGAFQRAEFYDAARSRWRELARVARSAVVLAEFGDTFEPAAAPVELTLAPTSPMLREWTVVCDSAELPAALAAWELPGQDDVPDRDRVFESVWTVEPAAVRTAARTCARIAQDSGHADAPALLYELAGDPAPGATDLSAVAALFNRVVAYVDHAGR